MGFLDIVLRLSGEALSDFIRCDASVGVVTSVGFSCPKSDRKQNWVCGRAVGAFVFWSWGLDDMSVLVARCFVSSTLSWVINFAVCSREGVTP